MIGERGRRIVKHHFEGSETMEKNLMRDGGWLRFLLSTILFLLSVAAPLGFSGCGQTAPTLTPTSAGKVDAYFGSPFNTLSNNFSESISTFDHSTGEINASSFVSTTHGSVPSGILNGTFAAAPTGFLSITENFATVNSVLTAQNPPVTGAWAVEIPGAGALGNLLAVNTTGGGIPLQAAPVAVAENTACPNFPNAAAPFLYVTIPGTTPGTDIADYGGVKISTQGSDVTLNAQPYLMGPTGPTALVPTTVTGGCSQTYFGPLTAYPLNSFETPGALDLINIGQSGLLVSSFSPSAGVSPGAFGGGTGVIGVAAVSSPVDVSAVVAAQYNGFFFAPQNSAPVNYDITVLASAFGDDAANSQACSTLQSSLVANNGQGANSVVALPSANSLYGGEFLTTTGSGAVNDPTGANGSENCDVVIDLGIQDPANNGLFPNATIFIGSNYPPFSAAKQWNCPNTTAACAASFPAAAVVGQVQGQYVIFVVASALSGPAAQLPNSTGVPIPQPAGIYLFQKSN
jgi:hypothetical protein